MSLNPEALQKLLIEMDNQLNKTKSDLSLCNLQLSRVETNLSLIKSTFSSLNKLCKPDEVVYQGVGKAFVAKNVKEYLGEISRDEKDFLDTKKNLVIKKDYLETTLEKTISSMQKIVQGK
ncbi:uncharacterized protein CANTADRAFT_56408 [Suhomyces tanzawaensis NRRL Y-17324]|uniref:Prefoldin n=1 Tax=Suhomyces tanzawaensis NRRL Y-17324 TaxID=984487 RepID=A0A1E4SD36_9ASCO|nr:uncharacterized protein CANTADRAFT_56408 [Suhomyces tanzawaensis NRRL Y-17324]ODV77429.1 hypothetical protein CANTADRAFT_56408 [Suhomyces tanzawaensis NRRL Y-17324]